MPVGFELASADSDEKKGIACHENSNWNRDLIVGWLGVQHAGAECQSDRGRIDRRATRPGEGAAGNAVPSQRQHRNTGADVPRDEVQPANPPRANGGDAGQPMQDAKIK